MSGSGMRISLFVCDWAVSPEEVTGLLSEPPADVRLVKVKCVGRVDPVITADSYLNGVDGVLVVGCKHGDCHFVEGGIQAENKMKMTKKLLGLAGFEQERLRCEWMTALDEGRLKETLTEFVHQVQAMGPSPLSMDRPDSLLREKMFIVKTTLEGFRNRALSSKELEVTEKGNVYGKKVSRLIFGDIQDGALRAEFYRNWVYSLLKRGVSSVERLSESTGLLEGQILRHIVAMRQRNLVSLDRIEGVTPHYRALEAL
jgi:F420-non-reducing hydrogenase iron-sulfur subunit